MSLSTLLRDHAWDESAADTGIFFEEPIPLDRFIRDRKYLGNPPLSEVQYEAVRHAERIYLPPTYELLAQSSDKAVRDYWKQPCRMVNLITLEWGKGSGKDHISRISALRVCYLLLCLYSPQGYYSMPSQDSIHCLNVASSSRQASRAFFKPMTRAVSRPGCWFQTMGVDIVEGTVRRGPKPKRPQGRESAQALLDTIRFAKFVEAVSGHSDADSQEGLNLIMGVADEIDAFKSRAELEKTAGANKLRESSSSAEAILEMLQTSASTRFPLVYKNVRISYPRYKGSTIQKLRIAGEKDLAVNGEKSRHYVDGPKATWEVNPRIDGRWVFEQDYKDDPIMAAAKYECKPTHAINPYFANEPALRACFKEKGQLPLTVDYVRDGLAWRPTYVFSPQLYPVTGAQYAMHADLALTGDRAGVSLAHVKDWKEVTVVGHDEDEREVGITESRPVIKVDFSISYESDKARIPPLEIQIRWARELCLELTRRGFPIVRFTFDQWQSVDSMQILETHGIETDRFSMDKDEIGWRTLRDLAYEGRLEAAEQELVIVELLGLSRLPSGKIDHPADGSKDMADSLAGACVGALTIGGREDEDGARAYPGFRHDFGGRPHAELVPIGMTSLAHLASEDPLPEDARNDRFTTGFEGGIIEDFGLSYNHD
jgi:hypothetical protein